MSGAPWKQPDCDHCSLPATSSCTGCLAAHYCCKVHQKLHWPTHKVACRSSPVYLKNQEVAKLKETLKEQETSLGVEHPDTLTSVGNLGTLLHAQGMLAEAELFHRRALEGQERTLGRDHPDTLSSVNNLGTLLQDQGKLTEAEPFLRRALEGKERTLGVEHPSTRLTAENLCLLLAERRSTRRK